MKRLIKNSIYIVIIAAILLVASRTYEIPRASSNEIKGDTPLKKTQSLVEYLNKNQEYKDFGMVSLSGIDYQTSTWGYGIMVFYSFQEGSSSQEIQIKYFSLLKEILSQTANFEFVERIMILVQFNDGYGLIVSADEESIKNIRKYPGQALLYTKQKPMAMAPINPDDGKQEEGGGK